MDGGGSGGGWMVGFCQVQRSIRADQKITESLMKIGNYFADKNLVSC